MRGYRFASESGYPSPWGIAAAMVLVGLFAWTAPMVEIKPLAFFQAVYAVAVFAAHFFLMPDWGFLRKLLQELGEMFEMAFLATMLALLLSLPLGFLAARNSVSNALVFQSTRGVLVLLRSLPDVILALAFVAVLGLGALPGVLAITLSSVGFMARFFRGQHRGDRCQGGGKRECRRCESDADAPFRVAATVVAGFHFNGVLHLRQQPAFGDHIEHRRCRRHRFMICRFRCACSNTREYS